MPSRRVVSCVLFVAGASLASAVVLGRQQGPVNQPGQATAPRMMVVNSGTDQAIPVVVQSGGEVQPVAVVSAPALSLAPGTEVATIARQQRWEYRVVSGRTEELLSALERAGNDGWEAVTGLTGGGAAGVSQILIKRPRAAGPD